MHEIKLISSPPEPITSIFNRTSCGVYEIFAKDGCSLPGIELPPNRLLYIGKSEDFSTREHFIAGRTSKSTLRRSIGAVLKEKLDLKAIPRNQWRNRKDSECYCFEGNGEDRLNEWMLSNLAVTLHEFVGADGEDDRVKLELKEFEKGMLRKLHTKPPLNLVKGNMHKPMVDELRKACRVDAETARQAKSSY